MEIAVLVITPLFECFNQRKKKEETKIWMYNFSFSCLSYVFTMVGMFLHCTLFSSEERSNFCLDSLPLIPQACKAKSPHYKANWPILFRICLKLKAYKRDAWLTSHLRFFLTKDTSCVFDHFHSHLEFLGFYVWKSTGLPFATCHPQVRLRKSQSENAVHLFNTFFFLSFSLLLLYVCMPVLIGQL